MAFPQIIQQLGNALIFGAGTTVTRYPAGAASSGLTAAGKAVGAYKYAAANANVVAIVAKAVVAANWRFAWLTLDTPSATSLFVIKLGHGAGAAGAFSGNTMELGYNFLTVTAAGELVLPPIWIPYSPYVANDGATDGVLADCASNNAAANDTINAAVGIMTSLGT